MSHLLPDHDGSCDGGWRAYHQRHATEEWINKCTTGELPAMGGEAWLVLYLISLEGSYRAFLVCHKRVCRRQAATHITPHRGRDGRGFQAQPPCPIYGS